MAKKKVNPQIKLDIEPEMDPKNSDFQKPDNWTPEDIAFYFNKALATLNKDNFTTAKEYIDLLVNQCLAEKHWNDGFNYFLTKIQEMGIEVETEQDKYRNLAEKLFYWRTVRMLIHSAGLMPYEAEILKYEIAKYYPNLMPMPTLPPAQYKEGLIGRTKRTRTTAPARPAKEPAKGSKN